MQPLPILESLFRWVHVGAGIVWIGHLYFFNWVNANFAATMDGDMKKKVVPELMPRALYWFRWGAAWTWVTGVLLLLLVFYHGGIVFEQAGEGAGSWGVPAIVLIAVVFLAPFLYDALMKNVKNAKVAIAIGFVAIAAMVALMSQWAGFGYRGYVIHLGALFGTIMAWNVWYRIWPAQRKIIAAVKEGTPPDAALVALAGQRSRQNTYLSLGLLWTMVNAHTTWAAAHWAITPAVVLVAWWIGTMLFKRAPKVKGF